MTEDRLAYKIAEPEKIGSYNEFIRRFYPNTERIDGYKEDSDATRPSLAIDLPSEAWHDAKWS